MPSLLPHLDPDGLLEYSVVFTDRSLNSMSGAFQQVMRDLSALLKEGYKASAVAVIAGGGTFGMESIARQFAAAGLQIAAGVPLQCGEGPDFKSFRIGLFGLDKLHNIPRSVKNFEKALDQIFTS